MRVRETMRSSGMTRAAASALLALGLAVSAGIALAAPPAPDAAAPQSRRPTVEAAPNGTPLVQITNPSAGGVSRNQFTSFDVDAGGVILNNSRGLAQTELAGWIAPNPNLEKEASVILNEVTSADPSRLLGYLEVAGSKAEVVIANPNGITCDGCGFINASRGTLTTGTPVFGGTGTLDAFRVAGGAIAIEGAGLNAANVDRVALISRAVTANAGIWARELAVVTGANEVDRSTLAATPIAGAGPAPVVSIDVGALGGMYARKILLVGTERGVGVTSAGTLASEGEFRLDSDGQISLRGPTTAGGAMSVRTGDALDARETLYSAGSLRIDAAGAVTTAGFLGAQGDLDVQAGRIALGGDAGAGVTPEARVAGQGSLSFTASGAIDADGRQLVSGGAISLDAAELSLSGATVQAMGGISLTGREGDVALTGALVEAAGPLTLTAGRDIVAVDGTLTSAGALTGAAAGLFDNTRGLVIGGQVQLRATELRSLGAEAALVSAGDMQLHATRLLNADGALVYAGRDLLIAGASDGGGLAPAESVLNRSAQLEAGRDLTIVADVLRNEKSVFEVSYDVEPVLVETDRDARASELTKEEWREFVEPNYDYSDGWSKKKLITQTATYIPQVTTDSAPAELRAGGDLTLRAGSVVNDQSRMAAGGSILDEGVSYTQPSLPGNLVEERTWYWVDAREFDFCNGAFDVGCETSHHSGSAEFTSAHELRSSVVELIPNTAERVEQTGAAPEAPGLAASAPAITLPSNRLFTTHRDPGHRYLVETDPRFTKLGNFISSDYLLDRLPVNPEAPLKRLGDGFYEQRLVMDELFRATGTPYLPGSADAMAQYQALLDEGYVYAKELSLTPGIALSADQVVRLTSPMVWMVTVRVDGQDVLAPKLYMPSGKHAAVTAGGSIVAGGGIAWQLAGEHSLGGIAAAGKDLTVSAGTVRSQAGRFEAGRDARIDGREGVQLDAATVVAGGNATVESASGSVRVAAGTHQHQKDGANVTDVVGTVIAAGEDVTVRAAQDVALTAATLQAAKDVQLSAGRNLSMDTAEQVTRSDGATAREQVGTTAVAAGALRVTAEDDARLAGAQLGAGGDVHVEAGGDLTLAAVHDSLEAGQQRGARIVTTHDEVARGTTIQGGGAVALAARGTSGEGTGRVALEAATVQAGGALTVKGEDVRIADAREAHASVTTDAWSKKGFLSTKKVTTRDEVNEDLSVGSLLSGGTVAVESAGDLLVQGSQVVGQGDVTLRAAGDLVVAAGEDRFTEKHERLETRSGLLGASGGLGFTIGTQNKRVTTDIDGVSHLRSGADGTTVTTGSTIGSVEGSLVLDAGRRLDLRGSDVTAARDLTLAGEDVLLDSVYDVTRTRQETVLTQTGFTVAISNGAIDAAVAAYQTARRATEVKDDRLRALYALRAMRQAQAAADAVKALARKDSRSVTVTVGVSHSESRTESTTLSSTALGSSVIAGGDVRVTARGAASGEGGDLTVVGSTVEGGSVSLDAARDLHLRSAENRLDTSSDSLSWSITAGVGVTVGQGKGAAAGFQATGSIGTSEEDAHDRTYSETAIRSGGAISLRSGRDTALRGAVVTGDSIAVDVGGDLSLRSDQDSSTYHSTDLSLAGQGTVGYGYSASLTASYAGMESKYRSVQEQTGLFAGQGGYTVKVAGKTHLQGAVIASEADASKNLLDTGSLTWSDLDNESKFSAVSVSVTVGTGGGGVTPGVPIQGEKSSTTRAAVSPGTIVVRDGATDLSGLSQDTAHAANAIGNSFDRAKIEEQKELVQVFGEEGFKAVGDLAQRYTKPYTDAELLERQATRYEELLAKGDALTEQERQERQAYEDGGFRPDNVQQTLAHAQEQKQRYQEQYDRWKDGSPLKTALHAAVGAMQAGLGGGSIVAGGVGAGTSERLSEVTANLPSSVRPYVSAVIGAVAAKVTGANGLGAITGGAVADTGAKFNRDLHLSELQRIYDIARRMEAEGLEKYGFENIGQAINALQVAACGLVQCAAQIADDDVGMHLRQRQGESPEMARWRNLLLADAAGTGDFKYTTFDAMKDFSNRVDDEAFRYLTRKREPGVRPRLSTLMLTGGESLEATPEELSLLNADMRRHDTVFNSAAAYGALAGVVRFGENLVYLSLDTGMAIGGDRGPNNSALTLVGAFERDGLMTIPNGIGTQIDLIKNGDAVTFGDFMFGSYMTASSLSNLTLNPQGLTLTVPALEIVPGRAGSLAWSAGQIVLPTLENVPAALGPAAGSIVLMSQSGGSSDSGEERPTWRESEVDVGKELPKNAREQVAFKAGQEVPTSTKGSVRPDWCYGKCTIEVKNYDINTNSDGLVQKVAEQAKQRAIELPEGTTQKVVIDVRGQQYSQAQLAQIARSIQQRSGGVVKVKDISFKKSSR